MKRFESSRSTCPGFESPSAAAILASLSMFAFDEDDEEMSVSPSTTEPAAPGASVPATASTPARRQGLWARAAITGRRPSRRR